MNALLRSKRRLADAILAFVLSAGGATAGPWEDGVNANNRGDYEKAFQLWKLGAKQGDARAQFGLGRLYAGGKGVMKNTVEAAEWYRLAADQGNPNAQHFLGKAYEEGRGVPQDYVLAHMWLNLAASNPAPWFELDRHEVLTRLKELTVKMTSEQIAEAQRMVREWKFNVER